MVEVAAAAAGTNVPLSEAVEVHGWYIMDTVFLHVGPYGQGSVLEASRAQRRNSSGGGSGENVSNL